MMNSEQKSGNTQSNKNMPKWFYLFPVLIPVLFFIILEIFLRVINYGNDYTLFKQVSASYPDRLFINPHIARKYFSNLNNIPAPVNDSFDKVKKTDAFRVFVLGGSSVEGFPYVANASFPRDLKRRLELLYPDKTIEVVNCGMSAISSYSVRDFVPAVIKQKPDLIIIYMGHNEYYGALGVASSVSGGHSRWLTNLSINLENFRTYQLISNIIRWCAGFFRSNTPQTNATLMERMVGKSLVPLNSELFKEGINQFEGNLNDILKMFKQAGVPVIIGSLTSNVKDQKPFVSKKTKDLPAADDVYKKAESYLNSGDTLAAKNAFIEAKDLDELRFRAPEIFNSVIRRLSSMYDDPFIDIDSVFEAASPYGIVGSNLIVDHLHPDITGYKLMAKAFYIEMEKVNLLPYMKPMNITPAKQDSILNSSFPFTRLDSTIGRLTIDVITGTYPFVPKDSPNYKLLNFKQKDFIDSLAYRFIARQVNLADAHAGAAERYFADGNIQLFCREVNSIIADKPYDVEPYNYAARKLISTKHFNEAVPFLTGLNKLNPSAFSTKWMGQIFLQGHNYESALKYLAESLKFSGSDPEVWYNIAGAYYYLNRPADALNAVRKSLELNPHYQAAINFYYQLEKTVRAN